MGGYFSSLLHHIGHSIVSQTNSSIVSKHGTVKFADVNSSNFGVNNELESRDSGLEITALGKMAPGLTPLTNTHTVEPAIVRPPFHMYITNESQLNAPESVYASFPERDEEPITLKEELTSEPEVLNYKRSQIPETEKDSQKAIVESNSQKFSHVSMLHGDEKPLNWREQEFSKNAKPIKVSPQINESQQIPGKVSFEEWQLSIVSKIFDLGMENSHKSAPSQTLELNNPVPQSQRILEKRPTDQNSSQDSPNTIQLVTDLTLPDTHSVDHLSSSHISLAPPRSLAPSNNRTKRIKEKLDSGSLIQEVHKENNQEISGRKMPVQEKSNSFLSQNEVSEKPLKSNGWTEVGQRNVRERLSLSIGSISITVEEPKEAFPPRIIQVFENSSQDETSSRLNRHYVRIR